jgi:hypothetical protein
MEWPEHLMAKGAAAGKVTAMARKASPGNLDADEGKVLDEFTAAISGLSPDQMRGVLNQLMAAGRAAAQPGPVPSRRRPQRSEVVTYRVRIDLAGTKPPLWRRLELASDLRLDAVHDIIQGAFGWTDSHLHRFASGPEMYSRDAEQYLCPFDVEEGEPGVPEGKVRLDEVLSKVGDRLYYAYDFGDDWEHVLKLEAVRPRGESAPLVTCIGGRRPGPPEDCGGVGMYELITAAADPGHRDHAEAMAELRSFYGDESMAMPAIAPFDLAEVNAVLSGLGPAGESLNGAFPGPLGELVSSVLTAAGQRRLRQMIADALAPPAHVPDVAVMAHMVHPYTWLLNRVGADGIPLTDAGYLPPAHVLAAIHQLDLRKEWPGESSRESQTIPVLHLRRSAIGDEDGPAAQAPRQAGLHPSRAEGCCRSRCPVGADRRADADKVGRCLRNAGRPSVPNRYGSPGHRRGEGTVADFLGAMGWAESDGMPLTGDMANFAAWDTWTVLRRLGAYGDEDPLNLRAAQPTPNGLAFARAALRTWPSSG